MSRHTNQRVFIPNVGWVFGPGRGFPAPKNAATTRDDYWLAAFELAREANRTEGRFCIACGGYLWDQAGSDRLYCDDTCKRRHARRKERHRSELRKHRKTCHFCGCTP
jgi:hypothetical protein